MELFSPSQSKRFMGQNIATTGKKRRVSTNKSPEPSYAIIDSQSVKTCGAAEDKGFDGGKKVKGRKRHIVVDPMGNLLGVVVHAAHIHDTKAGIFAAQKAIEAYPSIKAFSVDAGYRKTFKQEMQEWFGLPVDISEKISGSWQIIPKRWIVERSFAWLGWSRRLAKDFGWCPKKYAACFFSNLN